MIQITLEPIPDTRGKEKGLRWKASCRVEGVEYEAASRSGAVYALCRVLKAARIADAGAEVTHADGRVQFRLRSIYDAASRTVKESAKTPVCLERFEEWEARPVSPPNC